MRRVFCLIQNPQPTPATVTVTYLQPAPHQPLGEGLHRGNAEPVRYPGQHYEVFDTPAGRSRCGRRPSSRPRRSSLTEAGCSSASDTTRSPSGSGDGVGDVDSGRLPQDVQVDSDTARERIGNPESCACAEANCAITSSSVIWA